MVVVRKQVPDFFSAFYTERKQTGIQSQRHLTSIPEIGILTNQALTLNHKVKIADQTF